MDNESVVLGEAPASPEHLAQYLLLLTALLVGLGLSTYLAASLVRRENPRDDNNSTVADKIREAEDDDLPAVLNASEHEGMHDFTSSLARLVEEDWIELKVAERYAPNAEALRSKVRGIHVKADTLVQRVKR